MQDPDTTFTRKPTGKPRKRADGSVDDAGDSNDDDDGDDSERQVSFVSTQSLMVMQ